ncbi:hypothetical protein NUW58_g7276 [Xylaria curta]|uniref:Uncharacterized protein n=1 Tax=Xylaria curta TaxID=42375 RepID=A0ACC1NJQ5_9PEZI|nr:hypothetical protein NUW58_g7276 [Xylaria curta]
MPFKHTKILIVCLVALFSVVIANNDDRDSHRVAIPTRTILAKRNSTSPIRETKGGITRHLGISRPRRFETVWTWFLDSDGSLSWKDLGSNAGWQTYNSSLFISAPEVLNVWPSSQDLRVAFAIQADTGHMMYLPYFAGKWESDKWHDLGGRFTYRPTPVSGTTGLSGVFGVNEKGELLYNALYNQYLPLKWTEWVLMGTGFTSEVAATSASPGMWEVVGLANGTYKHGLTDYEGSSPEWTDLGRPPHSIELGWPKIVVIPDLRTGGSPRGTVDVVVVADGVVWHKLYDGTSWSEEWTRLPPSHDGLEIMNSQELLVGYRSSWPTTGYLFSRGSDNCVYQNQFSYSGYNETTGQYYMDWLGWNSLWCSKVGDSVSTDTRQSPLAIAAIAQYDNRFDLVIQTPSGTLEHTQVYRENGTFEGVIPKWVAIKGNPWKFVTGNVLRDGTAGGA